MYSVLFFSTNLVPNSCLFFVLYNFVIGPVHILLQGLPGSSYVTDCQLIYNYPPAKCFSSLIYLHRKRLFTCGKLVTEMRDSNMFKPPCIKIPRM